MYNNNNNKMYNNNNNNNNKVHLKLYYSYSSGKYQDIEISINISYNIHKRVTENSGIGGLSIIVSEYSM